MKRAIALIILFVLFFTTLLVLPTSVYAANPRHVVLLRETQECAMCDLSNAYLIAANLEGNFMLGSNLSRANFKAANLRGASLSRANLSGADLSMTNLTLAKLALANLTNANLDHADLSKADLLSANLTGVNLDTAKLCQTIMPDGIASNRDC
jgi:uncharacterized protein YjbI with pentapeptide repeats